MNELIETKLSPGKEKFCPRETRSMRNKAIIVNQNQSIAKNDIKDIAQLADDFWTTLDEEKKIIRKVSRASTPLSERTTFSTKMKLK